MGKSRARDSLKSNKEYKRKRKSTQNEKTKFRGTSVWQKFRKFMKGYDGNTDYITDRPLRKGWNLHHIDLDQEHYTDISNPDHFIALNSKTHDFIHWAYEYYKDDEDFIGRLQEVLDEMVELNEEKRDA